MTDAYSIDVIVNDCGGVVQFQPESDAAKEWVKDNLPDLEDWQWFGDSFCVERRCAEDIVIGMKEDGLEVR